MEKKRLTTKQYQAITHILENYSINEVSKKIRVSRTTLYNWLGSEQFKKTLNEQREMLFETGLDALKAATEKAARTMIELLDSDDRSVKRLAAKEILNLAIKVNELREIEERVSIIEQLVEQEKHRFK